ncbi:MAG TPA: TonB-dependent receptor [Novosphingobium sp.]|nr:TonB-dependent receptor [Novosphingobium sp.]
MATPAMAQTAADTTASGDQLQDIVVTARKVAENIQKVPIAITAYSGEELIKQNVRALPEVALLTPGMQIAPALTNVSAVNIMIRGQVQTDTLATIDPSIGVYVDGVYWARAYGLTATMVDIANFQALKGPQGTLFGRNTTGGAVLINTKDPSFADGLSGSISGTYGRFNQQSLTAVLNVPLVNDKLAARLVYSGNRRDGYVLEKNSGRMISNLNDYTVRGKLLIQPTEDFKVLLSADKFHTDNYIDIGRLTYFAPNGLGAFEAGVEALGAAGCAPFTAGVPSPACIAAGNARGLAETNTNRFTTSFSALPHAILSAETYTATATLGTSFGEVKAIGGYRLLNSIYYDGENDGSSIKILDSGGTSAYGYTNQQYMKQWSGELTVTGKALNNALDFAVGAFVFHEYGHDDTPASTVTEYGKALTPGGLRSITSSYGQIDTKSLGFYGQGTYHINDKLSFTGGIRWSRDKRGLASTNVSALVDPNSTAVLRVICNLPVCPYSRSASFSGWAYTASLDYQATEDLLVYLKTAKGFRSGGQVLRGVAGVPASLLPFAPETVYSYEGGLKSEFFDRRLRVNLAAYYTHQTGRQVNTTVTINRVTSTVTSNAGVVDTYGGEFDATAILGHGFKLSATAAYTKPKYIKFIDFNGFDRRFEPLQLVPRWTATLSPEWNGDIGENKLSLRADFAYQSSQFNFPQGFYQDATGVWHDSSNGTVIPAADVAGYNAANTDKQHVLVNANATLTLLDGKLDLTVWGKNLTNLKDYTNSLILPGISMGRSVLREPRTYGVTAKVTF